MSKIFKDIESGYNISVWGEFVIKFDVHKFYKHYSGQGFKGVDYLIINKDYLYLIELKNYTQYREDKAFAPKDLNETFLQKCDDTLGVIEAFYQFLENGFWTRIFVLRFGWYFTCPKEWKHWIRAYHLYEKGQVIMMMHVEE